MRTVQRDNAGVDVVDGLLGGAEVGVRGLVHPHPTHQLLVEVPCLHLEQEVEDVKLLLPSDGAYLDVQEGRNALVLCQVASTAVG